MPIVYDIEQPSSPPDGPYDHLSAREMGRLTDERAELIRQGQSDHERMETFFEALDSALAFRREPGARSDIDRLRLSRFLRIEQALRSGRPAELEALAAILREALDARYTEIAEKSFDLWDLRERQP